MTYKELYEKAASMLDRGEITLGDFNKMVKPLNVEIHHEPHWIPVTERLPKEETDVLVTVHFLGLNRTHRNGWNAHIKESFYVEVASHINGEWSSASDEYKIAKDRHKVVAWMPLPEPYKEVTE